MRAVLRPPAEADLTDAARWYESQRVGLSGEFLDEVRRVLTSIERLPELHPEVYRGVRRVNCRRFPYAVYFKLTQRDILVLAVIHQRRDPRVWQRRADQP